MKQTNCGFDFATVRGELKLLPAAKALATLLCLVISAQDQTRTGLRHPLSRYLHADCTASFTNFSAWPVRLSVEQNRAKNGPV